MGESDSTVVGQLILRLRATIEEARACGDMIAAVSGGVDSAVAYVLASSVLGHLHVHPVLLDTGFLRAGEAEAVSEAFRTSLGATITVVNCGSDFVQALSMVEDSEDKRRLFRDMYFAELEKMARVMQCDSLLQGTQYRSDLRIYNNDTLGIRLQQFRTVVEPLRGLNKEQVRATGRALGLPPSFVNRMPFPGPGLLVRVVGRATPERLDLIRQLTLIVDSYELGDGVYQGFPVLMHGASPRVDLGVPKTGAIVALRLVATADQANYEPVLDPKTVRSLRDRLLAHEGVGRVLVDVTPRPPGTVELG